MNNTTQRIRCAASLLSLGVLFLLQSAFAQDAVRGTETLPIPTPSLPNAPQPGIHSRHGVETSIALGGAAQLTASRITESTSSIVSQSLSPSAGLLFSFRQSFKPWLGYSVNFGYTRATYRYIMSAPAPFTGMTGETFIPNHVYETSVSYIATKHFTDRLSLFGEAGAGALGFISINRDIRYTPSTFSLTYRSNTFHPVGIGGFGVDYRMSHGLGLRAEYRGLFVKYPDYGSGSIRPTTLTSQPTLGLTYSFGRH